MRRLAKATLGPTTTMFCDHCGRPVALTWWSVLHVLPCLAGIGATTLLLVAGRAVCATIALLIAWAIALVIQSALPLVRRPRDF